MERKNLIHGLCPQCGKELDIPQGLEAFSCLYCGSRIAMGRFAPQTAIPGSEEEAQTLLAKSLSILPEALTGYPDCMEHLTQTKFLPYFAAYEEKYKDAFVCLDRAIRMSGDAPGTAEKAAEALLRRVEAHAMGKNSRMERVRATFCLLFAPCLGHLGLPAGEDFLQELYTRWQLRYPKQSFKLTTYEEIVQGFTSRKLCFITTAVCKHLQKPDDCPELTAFRAFRDGYLSACPDGSALIARYYEIAPGIVLAIDLLDEPEQAYPAIWETYLSACYAALGQKDFARCKKIYTQMVQMLAKTYWKEENP